jgi:hypothetical protein
MAAPSPDADLEALPPKARRRIERLENAVSELTGALGTVVAEMRRQGLTVPVTRSGSAVAQRVFKVTKVTDSKSKSTHFTRVTVGRKPHPSEAAGAAGPAARGEAARLEWVTSGEVIPAKTLAHAWGVTPQALGPAAKRGHLFAVVIKGQRYYPKEFLVLDRDDVATVCKQLEPLTASEKLFFWKQPHGALEGRTVAEALGDRKDGAQLLRVAQLANAKAAQARDAAQA